jgi:hypothetical protein
MNQYAQAALKAFSQNLQTPHESVPLVQHQNLYKGLSSLAQAVGELHDKLEALQKEVSDLKWAAQGKMIGR